MQGVRVGRREGWSRCSIARYEASRLGCELLFSTAVTVATIKSKYTVGYKLRTIISERYYFYDQNKSNPVRAYIDHLSFYSQCRHNKGLEKREWVSASSTGGLDTHENKPANSSNYYSMLADCIINR